MGAIAGALPAIPALRGACDTHMHIYAPQFAALPGARTPSLSHGLDDYRALQRRLGLERVVVVHPTAYGTDNACTLWAMAQLGAGARGIAMIEPGASDAEIRRLTAAGMRGLRLFMMAGSPYTWDQVPALCAKVAPHGWHVQFQFDGTETARHAPMLERLPCPFVIDHIGRFTAPVSPADADVRALLDLVDGGRCWVKLSAPYHGSKEGPPRYADIGWIARELVRIAPDRMLWASNWPHPSLRQGFPDDRALLDILGEWAPDAATQEKILVTNPARLYGY